MRQLAALCAFVIVGSLAAAGAASAAQATSGITATFGRFTVEARSFGGHDREGWFEFLRDVKVTSADLTMTCDRLKVWLTKDGRGFDRLEAAGSIVVRVRYVAADKTEWQVVGKAEAASYDGKAGQGVMKGSVDFQATNRATGAVVTVAADTLTYDMKTRQFHFARSSAPVRVEWQEPFAPEKPAAAPAVASPKEEGEKRQ